MSLRQHQRSYRPVEQKIDKLQVRELEDQCFKDLVVYVTQTGSDSADGQTPATAWRTIQHAIDEMPRCCGNYFVLIGADANPYDEELVYEKKSRGRLHLFGQPKFVAGTWGSPGTITAYNDAPANEYADRHLVTVNGISITSGMRGMFLVVDFGDTGVGTGPYEVLTILERVSSTQCYVAGQGPGNGYPFGRNATSYTAANARVVVMAPGVNIERTSTKSPPILFATGPANVGVSDNPVSIGVDLYAMSLTWVKLDGASAGPSSTTLISSIPTAIEGCQIENTNSPTYIHGLSSVVSGNYWGEVRKTYSGEVAVRNAVESWEAAYTSGVNGYLSPNYQADQRRHGGRIIEAATTNPSLTAIQGTHCDFNGLLLSSDVLFSESTVTSNLTVQFDGNVTMQRAHGVTMPRAKVDGRWTVEEACHLSNDAVGALWVAGGGGVAVSLHVEDTSKLVLQSNIYIDNQTSTGTVLLIEEFSSLQAQEVVVNRGSVDGYIVRVQGGAALICDVLDSSSCTDPQQPLIFCNTNSFCVIGTLVVTNGAVDYGSDGVLRVRNCSNVTFGAVSNATQNSAGFGMQIRHYSNVKTPNGFGASPTITGATAADAMDLGGLGATVYSAGAQTDIGAALPQLCARNEE